MKQLDRNRATPQELEMLAMMRTILEFWAEGRHPNEALTVGNLLTLFEFFQIGMREGVLSEEKMVAGSGPA